MVPLVRRRKDNTCRELLALLKGVYFLSPKRRWVWGNVRLRGGGGWWEHVTVCKSRQGIECQGLENHQERTSLRSLETPPPPPPPPFPPPFASPSLLCPSLLIYFFHFFSVSSFTSVTFFGAHFFPSFSSHYWEDIGRTVSRHPDLICSLFRGLPSLLQT